MRIFTDPMEMIKEVERDLFEMGTIYQSDTCQDKIVTFDPNYQTKELFGYAYMLTDFPEDRLEEMVTYTGYLEGKNNWVDAEVNERLFDSFDISAPPNPGDSWRQNSDLWGPFLRNGCFSYSYAERWRAQLPYIIRELQTKPNTRQTVMTMYDRHEDMMNWGGRDRVPCSISYQFGIREDRLIVIYSQRSCDFIKFFAADVYFTIRLLQYVASAIGREPGQFIHFLGSLHAFQGDLLKRGIF